MSTNVGAVDFELLLNSNPFNKGLKSATNTIKSSGIENSLKRIGKLAMAAFSVKTIINFGKECINLGSDLAEVQNVVDVTFGSLNTEVNKFAENAITQFGLGQTVTKKYVGTFGAMAKAFNFSNKEALAMSETLTGLTGDVASFYNLSSDEAYTKLKSVFTGETETLKDLGVVMTQNALDQYALANGYGKTTSKMSEQEKVALRYKFVLDKLNIANGDFARTSDSWANQTRVLSLRFNELKAALGQGFINIFTPIVKGVNMVLSKLQVLANAFKSFTEMIFGNASGDDGSNAVSDLASDASKASDAVSGIGDSAKKTKKDLLGLRGIDEINNLTTSSDNSSSSNGAGEIDTSGLGDLINSSMQQANTQMDAFIRKAKELMSIFKNGFDISFGSTNFDGIIKHLTNMKDTIIDIWTDSKVTGVVGDWAKTLLFTLGQATGAVARIGTNLAEGFIGSVDKYLSQNSERIKNFIVNMFNISSKDITLTGNLWQALGEISDVFKGDTAKQIGADIIAMFTNPFMSAIEICQKLGFDLKGILFQPIIDNVDKLKTTFNNVLTPIETVTRTLADVMTYMGDKWNEVYNQRIHPFLESLKAGLSDTFSKYLEVYNKYIVPFLQNMATKFSELWETHLKPFVNNVAGLIGNIIDAIKTVWENWTKPFLDWIIQNIVPVLVPIFEAIWNTIVNVFGSIIDTISGIIQVFKGLIDFIVGVFTGDWDRAWNGIKTIIEGKWNTIKGIFSIAWNNIVGTIGESVKAIFSIISTKFETIYNSIKTVVNNIKSTIENVFNIVKDVSTNIWNEINNVLSTIWNSMWSRLKNGASNAWNSVRNIFGNVASWFRDKFSSAWEAVKNVFSSRRKSV